MRPRILGFDGYHCRVPPDDPNTVYAEGEYGRLYRYDRRTGNGPALRPGATRPDEPKGTVHRSPPSAKTSQQSTTL